MTPYVYGEQPPYSDDLIKLNTNESPYPLPSEVAQNLKHFNTDRLRIYPDPSCKRLKEAMSKAYNIPKENVVFGNGSDELLALSFRLFFNPGDKALFTQYTYSAYPTYAAAMNIETTVLEMSNQDFKMDLQKIKQHDFKVLYLTNPNAPTSIALPTDAIASLADALPDRLILVDEAYADFAEEHCLELALTKKNVGVFRTFSKAYSFCGARLGYFVGPKELVEGFIKIKDPYNVNAMTQDLATAIVENQTIFQTYIEAIKTERSRAINELRKRDFLVFDSQTNFVLCEPKAIGAKTLYEKLKERNIYIRYFSTPGLEHFVRISIGSPQQMNSLYKNIDEILQN